MLTYERKIWLSNTCILVITCARFDKQYDTCMFGSVLLSIEPAFISVKPGYVIERDVWIIQFTQFCLRHACFL